MSTSSNNRTRAENTRRDYFKRKTAQLPNILANLEKPDMAAGSIVDPEDGTLHKDLLQDDLELLIPQWENLPEFDLPFNETLQLKYSLTGLPNSFQTVGPLLELPLPISPTIFPIKMKFPKANLPRDGKLWIAYNHVDFMGAPYSSDPIELTCDTVAPWNQTEPTFADAPPLINEAYLAANPEGIEVTLTEYPDRKPGDRCELFYLSEPPRGPDDLTIVANSVVLDASRQVTLPIDTVRDRGDGRFYITYLLYDKAHNRSNMALYVHADVVLGNEPADLQPPEVPLAADGLVDLKDAQAGVSVRIPEYQHRKNRDMLVIKWGNTLLDEEPLGSRPFPIDVPVFNQALNTEYGAATGPVTTSVSYQVKRGHVLYGPEAKDVEVDFSVAGPERPDPDPTWPDPVNPRLDAPEITSDSGLSNEVAPPDRGKPATLTFTWYDGVDDGHVVDFYWGGTLVTSYTVDMADAPSKDFVIPWAVISAAGNNDQLPVHYTLRAGVDAANEQESPRQYVKVHAISMAPDDMEFLDLTPNGFLGCPSLWDMNDLGAPPTFRARVPALAPRFNVSPGTVIQLHWYVTKGMDGSGQIGEVSNSETLNLTQEQIDMGFTWRIGIYEDHILPIYAHAPQFAFAHVWYVVDPLGAQLISAATQNIVSISAPTENLTCSLTPPTP